MKNRKTLLHICHVPTQNATRPFISQKNMDITLVIVSLAGLISALSFLLTITR